MTVAELIKILEECPEDAPVFREGGDYKDDWRPLQEVRYQEDNALGQWAGVYLS